MNDTSTQLVTFEEQRRAAIRAARAAQWQQTTAHLAPRPETRPPVVIRTGWEGIPMPPPSPKPGDDKPGFGTGAITVLVLVGVFALGWQVVTRMDPSNLAFIAGAIMALGGVFAAMILALWIGDASR